MQTIRLHVGVHFQLAFLLMDINSIVFDNSEDRLLVDLIWFPTGGGEDRSLFGTYCVYYLLQKTEIYRKIGWNYSDYAIYTSFACITTVYKGFDFNLCMRIYKTGFSQEKTQISSIFLGKQPYYYRIMDWRYPYSKQE